MTTILNFRFQVEIYLRIFTGGNFHKMFKTTHLSMDFMCKNILSSSTAKSLKKMYLENQTYKEVET